MADVNRLEQSLKSLRSEIETVPIEDEEARQRLGQLVAELEKSLRQPLRSGEQKSLGEQLKLSILKLEAAHPRLAGVMNEVVESLASMGI